MSNQRIVYIDLLKAFAIFLVVLGHTIGKFGNNIRVILDYGIYPYHMPLFAILSGLFFSVKIGFIPFFRKKFIQIALPLIVWCFVSAIVIRGINETYLHFTEGFNIHFKSWIECYLMWITNWGFWFLRALFLSFIYAYCSIRICQRNVTIGVLISVFILHSLSFSGILPNMFLNEFIFLYPFFCAGILIKEYMTYISFHYIKIFWTSTLIFIVCMMFWQGRDDCFYDMNTSVIETEGSAGITGIMVLWKTLIRFLAGTSASIILILLSKKFLNKFHPPILLNIGRNTLGIYILQTFFFDIIPAPTKNLMFDNKYLSLFVCLCFAIIIVLLSNIMVVFTSKNSKLKLLLWGKIG